MKLYNFQGPLKYTVLFNFTVALCGTNYFKRKDKETVSERPNGTPKVFHVDTVQSCTMNFTSGLLALIPVSFHHTHSFLLESSLKHSPLTPV